MSTKVSNWPRLAVAVSLLAVIAASAADRLNIIFILSDDVAQGDLGCDGQKLIQTPNLDRMAAEGTRYMQAYTAGTSVRPRAVQPEGQTPMPEGTYTIAKLMKSEGYATATIGKWGMGMFGTTGAPKQLGVDHFYGYNCQRHAHSYFPTYLYNDDQRFDLPGNDGKTVGKIYAQELISKEAVRRVKANNDRPFFLFYAVTLPHGRSFAGFVFEGRSRTRTRLFLLGTARGHDDSGNSFWRLESGEERPQ